jgi:phage tail tape-measure protein
MEIPPMADRKSTLTLALVDGISGPGAAAGRVLNQLGRNVKNLFGIMAGLGLAFGAVELARFGKEAVNAYAEHERVLMRLRQMYGATREEIKHLDEVMLKTAQDTAQPMTAVEAAMVAMREMGFNLKQATDALPIAARAAWCDGGRRRRHGPACS